MKTFRSNGKLLLTGEYVVLDGAKALAIPTRYGQDLEIAENDSTIISWKSYNELGKVWFEDQFTIESLETIDTPNAISKRLKQIFRAIKALNPQFLEDHQGYTITTHQDFNRFWGLGTSSTLINNLANWAGVDAFALLNLTFEGSGYDIACAKQDTPLIYQLNPKPEITPIDFNPNFKSQLYFVYLNQKQNSRDGISNYRSKQGSHQSMLSSISAITEQMAICKSLAEFEKLIQDHETIISRCIGIAPIKAERFKDFNGSVKSLGAWGGDFVLVTCQDNPRPYFNSKGFSTVIPYNEMVLN